MLKSFSGSLEVHNICKNANVILSIPFFNNLFTFAKTQSELKTAIILLKESKLMPSNHIVFIVFSKVEIFKDVMDFIDFFNPLDTNKVFNKYTFEIKKSNSVLVHEEWEELNNFAFPIRKFLLNLILNSFFQENMNSQESKQLVFKMYKESFKIFYEEIKNKISTAPNNT
jgi:hypothetical protein